MVIASTFEEKPNFRCFHGFFSDLLDLTLAQVENIFAIYIKFRNKLILFYIFVYISLKYLRLVE